LDKRVTEFRKQEERRSRLEKPGVRLCDLILGSPFSQARLEEAAGQLEVEHAARWEADAELEALQSSTARV
jgi:hypothetical protein